jgi:hypothetical protein
VERGETLRGPGELVRPMRGTEATGGAGGAASKKNNAQMIKTTQKKKKKKTPNPPSLPLLLRSTTSTVSPTYHACERRTAAVERGKVCHTIHTQHKYTFTHTHTHTLTHTNILHISSSPPTCLDIQMLTKFMQVRVHLLGEKGCCAIHKNRHINISPLHI